MRLRPRVVELQPPTGALTAKVSDPPSPPCSATLSILASRSFLFRYV